MISMTVDKLEVQSVCLST